MKKIFTVLLCFILIISCVNTFSASADEGEESSAISIGENDMLIKQEDNLALYVDTETANIKIEDINANKIWSAIPEDYISDMSNSYASIMNITYSGKNNLEIKKGTNSSGVSFELFQLDNGVKTVFSFAVDKSKFSIPVTVQLSGGCVKVKVLTKSIKESGKAKLMGISPYPNFGMGTSKQNGYAFIPDGSGAIIEYKDSASKSESYKGRVFGDDPSQDLIYKENSGAKAARLPVFGAKQENGAILGVIDNAQEFSYISATASDGNVTVCPEFIYRESDLTGIQQSDGGTRTMTILQTKPVSLQPTVNYYFLSSEDASYSGMARRYRKYLESKKIISEKSDKKTPAACFEAFGAVAKKDTFLGIKITKTMPVCTFPDLTDFEKKMNKAGIKNASYYLYGYLSGGFEGNTADSPDYIRAVGGEKGYKEFSSLAGNENVYTVFDMLCSYGKPFDYFRASDYTKSLNQTVVEQHYKILANGKWDKEFGSWKYYNIKKQKQYFSELIENLSKGSNIVLARFGEELPSDFDSKSSAGRDDFISFYNQVSKKLKSQKIGMAFEGANLYTLKDSTEIFEAPITSSGLNIESYSIPFYTMVFHGYLPISSTPVNDEGEKEEFMLKAFEQGVSSTWRIVDCDGYLLKDTKLNFLYNASVDYVSEHATGLAEAYNDIHSVLFDKCITEHKRIGNISITEYENGWKIVCNYGKESENYENIEIKPQGYQLIK